MISAVQVVAGTESIKRCVRAWLRCDVWTYEQWYDVWVGGKVTKTKHKSKFLTSLIDYNIRVFILCTVLTCFQINREMRIKTRILKALQYHKVTLKYIIAHIQTFLNLMTTRGNNSHMFGRLMIQSYFWQIFAIKITYFAKLLVHFLLSYLLTGYRRIFFRSCNSTSKCAKVSQN